MASSQLSSSPPESPRDYADDEEDGCDAFEVLEILGDSYTQKVLSVLAADRCTGSELVERADVSKATAYRRLDDLQDAGIVESTMRIDPNGHHCEEYYVAVDELSISFDCDGFAVDHSATEKSAQNFDSSDEGYGHLGADD
jgi:predicted transcriptional regulator